MAKRRGTSLLHEELPGTYFAFLSCFAYFAYWCFDMQAHFARDAADLWILVVFHDPSRYWTLSPQDPAQVHSQTRRWSRCAAGLQAPRVWSAYCDENWITKRFEVRAGHLLDQAPHDLRVGWKAWIKENGPEREGAGAAAKVPATGITSVVQMSWGSVHDRAAWSLAQPGFALRAFWELIEAATHTRQMDNVIHILHISWYAE